MPPEAMGAGGGEDAGLARAEAHALLAGDAPALGAAVAPPAKRQVIAERLAALIASGALSLGDPLPSERELAAAMGVSRETIRGALAVLSARGIVAVAQGARTTVASDEVGDLGLRALPGPASDYDLREIHEGRLMVEGRIARAVAGRVPSRKLDRLAGLIAAQEEAARDPVRYLILDREFHTTIYRACGNRVLSDLAATLYSYQLDHRRRAVSRPGAIERSIGDHRAILAALREGDGGAVAAAFGVHERRIFETTLQLLEGGEPQGGDPR